jgi:hypothetical protein
LDAPSSADRTGGSADVATDGDVSAEGECSDGVFAVEDDDKICDVGADLETPAYTTGRDTRWGGPRAIW